MVFKKDSHYSMSAETVSNKWPLIFFLKMLNITNRLRSVVMLRVVTVFYLSPPGAKGKVNGKQSFMIAFPSHILK